MKKMKFALAMLLAAGILMQPQAAVNGAQSAMRSWAYGVAPALFPFLALMPALTGPEACAAYESLFARPMRRLFRLPGSAAPAVIIGMISGSPGGAAAVCRIAAQTHMPAAAFKRIALAVCGVSPSYLILGVGQGLYGSRSLGLRLAAIQLLTQLSLLLLIKPANANEPGALRPLSAPQESRPIRSAVETMLGVCGYMVFFSVIAAVAAAFAGETAGRWLLLALDLPSALPQIVRWEIPGRLAVQGMAIGFGGICIAAQNLDVLRKQGIGAGEYLSARLLAAGISGMMTLPLAKTQILASGGTPTNNIYAFSLLLSCIFVLPALIYFSKNNFLNKPSSKKSVAGNHGNHHI